MCGLLGGAQEAAMATPVIELRDVVTRHGEAIRLAGVSFAVMAGECHCLLVSRAEADRDDLIATLAGRQTVSGGTIEIDGRPARFATPQDAADAGVAIVGEVPPLVPTMSATRNFWMGREPVKRFGPLKLMDFDRANRETTAALARVGVGVADPAQPVARLSTAQRRGFAMARAAHFGARVLVIDEPTEGLNGPDATMVLKAIVAVLEWGIGVVVLLENTRHALAVGDRFTGLDRGRSTATLTRDQATQRDLEDMLPMGAELLGIGVR